MAYIIGSVLVLITLIISGLIMRKKVYDEVDILEAWKMDIMNRNITGELSRIKALNLSGETQEKFESWKERWEAIVTNELPDIEEYLFDAEEAADRYRFPSAKKTLRKANQALQSIEQKIDDMLTELDQLMASEETSRKEIEKIEPGLEAMRKTLSQTRGQFGKAGLRFEEELDGLADELTRYHELANAGDYSDARKLADTLKQEMDALSEEIDAFPAIYRTCKRELPDKLNELYKGLRDMKDDGYRIEHLGFEKEVHDYQRRLAECMDALEKGETSEAKAVIPEMEERMEEMYQLLEKEALARNYVETKISSYQDSFHALVDKFDVTKEEVNKLKQAYHFEDSDMEKYLALDKSITQLSKQLETIMYALEHDHMAAHSDLRDELEDAFSKLAALQKEHDAFKKRIENLRKDEIEAKEQLKEMKHQLDQVNRRLNKSNVPGVPTFIWNKMDETANKNNQVFVSLEKQPLNMSEVKLALSEAKEAVHDIMEQTETMLDQAYLTEQVIQYANRYRSQNPGLAAKLAEAERLFRSYEYELSLEHAAKAVEEVEPGALKQIEEFQEAAN